MFANIAGIAGAQIFRSDDRPKYRRGFSINIAILTVGLALAALRFIDDKIWRRERVAEIQEQLARENESNSDDKVDGRIKEGTAAVGVDRISPIDSNVATKKSD